MALSSSRLNDHDLRILIFTATYFTPDGVTNTIRNITNYLRSRGATVMICSTVPVGTPEELLKEVIIVPGIKIPFQDAGDNYSIGEGLNPETLSAIEAFGPNVVHFTVPDLVGLQGIRWCQKNNVAYMGTWHSNYSDYLKYYGGAQCLLGGFLDQYLKAFYAQIPTIYVPTTHMLNRMTEMGYGEHTNLQLWARSIDLQWYTPRKRSQEFRLRKGFSDDDVVLLWAGRIVPEKRPNLFLEVVLKLREKGYPVKALVVGHGTFERTLSQFPGIVTCCGWLQSTALAEAYASSDILLFPSDVETFGNVTLEALASGCPAIVEEKCGGHLVENGVNGYCCPAGDFHAFYTATKNMVADKALRLQLAKQARDSVLKFDKRAVLQQMCENYKDTVQAFADPTFLQKKLASSPAVAGQNWLSTLCCDFQLARVVVSPLLNCLNVTQQPTAAAAAVSQYCIDLAKSVMSPFSNCLSLFRDQDRGVRDSAAQQIEMEEDA